MLNGKRCNEHLFAFLVQDDTIAVIRRVDDNWAEGKMADRIGIFPISFVEVLNTSLSLVNSPLNHSLCSTRIT